MKIEIERYRSMPCSLEVFKINEVDANLSDFGFCCDEDPDYSETVYDGYGCGDRRFHPLEERPSKETLDLYQIEESEYGDIQVFLESYMNIGACGWCV